VLAREVDRRRDILRVLGEHDGCGLQVGGEVPRAPGGVPVRVSGDDRVAGEAVAEGVDVDGGGFGGHVLTVINSTREMPDADLDVFRRAFDAVNRRDYDS
jgi:hypothetical protein